MATAVYEVKIGWENNKDFEGLYDDITDDVKSISFSRGKSDEIGKAEVGQCAIVVNNADAKYTPSYSSSVLYGNLKPKRPLRVRAVQQLTTASVTKALAAASNYDANDILSESASTGTAWTFSNQVKIKGGFGYIVKAHIICETTALIPHLTLFLFNVTPTCALNDNASNTSILHADESNYIGKIDFPSLENLGTGDSESLSTSSVQGNLPLAFNCAISDTSLYGVLVTRDAITGEVATMDMTIILVAEIPQHDLFFGFIEEIIPHPHWAEQDCVITATDGLDFLSRHDIATALYTNAKTGVIHSYILTDALWHQDMRLLDDGQDTVPYWYAHDIKARFAQEEIDDSEQGFSFIDGAGNFRFEDRHHRSTSIHQTSQGTFTNTMNNITSSLNTRNVYNIIKATVTPWAIQSSTTLWTLQEEPLIAAGEIQTWWGEASVSGESVFVGAWTTLDATDYQAWTGSGGTGTNMSGSLTIIQTNFAKTIKVEITNGATVPLYIYLLRARGTYYDDLTKVTRKKEDSTSQTAYQKRTLSIDGKYLTSADVAQDFCDYAIVKYKDPRAEITMAIMNKTEAILTQILTREVSDRITITNTELGITSVDYFIDYMAHDISLSGKLHTAIYRLSECSNEDFWCLGLSAFPSALGVGVQTKLGY